MTSLLLPSAGLAFRGDTPYRTAQLTLPGHVRAGESREALRGIRRADVNLALWQRRLPDWVERGLVACPTDRLPRLRLTAIPTRIAADLAVGLDGLAATEPELAAWLVADLADLAAILAERARAAQVVLRLNVLEGDACRFFHADNVTLRLVTTYRGRGTQWLAGEDAARLARGPPPPDSLVRAVPTGAVALFKGARAALSTVGALMHRSPPRRPGDDLRLFLAIDPAPS